MSSISVLLEVPDDILAGLMDGTLERVGGVVRDAETKRVVGWLLDTAEDLPSESPGNTIPGGGQGPGFPDVIANQQLMMGLQVANLAVSVVGFVVIYQKLNKIEHMLWGMDDKLDQIKSDLTWLDKKQLLAAMAPMVASIKSITSAKNIKDESMARGKLIDSDGKIDTAKEYFSGVIGRLLAEEMERHRPEEFAACYRSWIMANQASVDIMLALNETKEAKRRLEVFKLEHAQLGKNFHSHSKDVARRLRSGIGVGRSEEILIELGQQMVGAHDLIRGQQLQLELIASSEGFSNDWTLSNRNGRYVRYQENE